MVLESTMLCVDNSEFMRNGDFTPCRLQVEQDAVNLICQCKLRMNPENNVGLLTMSHPVEVLSTLTQDSSKIFMKMHAIVPKGEPNFLAAIRVAHLALKHRQGRNHKTRIVVFVGSPVDIDKNEFVKLAKRLKKEKVNVDLISFGHDDENMDALKAFIDTLNGKDGSSSHLVTVPPGSAMSEALMSSPILRGEDGSAAVPGVPGAAGAGGAMDFGVDPNEDPELALALRVSMEEQRARQEEESRRAQEASGAEAKEAEVKAVDEVAPQEAAAATGGAGAGGPNFDSMTEEEQIAWALQMSLGGGQDAEAAGGAAAKAASTSAKPGGSSVDHEETEPMDVDTDKNIGTCVDDGNEFADLLTDPAALEDLVKSLPGVDPNSKAVKDSIEKINKEAKKPDAKKKEDDKGKK